MLATASHPRPADRSRPRRRLAALAATVAAVAGLVSAAPALGATRAACADASTPIAQATAGQLRGAVLCLVNRERTADHLPRLQASAKLDHSAQAWTDQMVSGDDFSHGSAFTTRISAAGFDWSTAGENIATGYGTAEAVVAAWMRSPGHCANILDPAYRELGTGFSAGGVRGVSSQAGTWTQDFGRLMGQRALSTDTGPAQACYRS